MSGAALGMPDPGSHRPSDNEPGAPMKRSMIASTLLHVGLLSAVLLWQVRPEPVRPPVYRVKLVGAPAGVKNIGVVDPRPVTQPVKQAEAPSGLERPEVQKTVTEATKAAPKPPPAKATPTPTRTKDAGQADGTTKAATSAAPRAGSTAGGRGADVITIETNGIEFPSPGYLNNIMRQVQVRFRPDERFVRGELRAEVSFLIHRDGRVSEIRVETTSGEYRFDLDARSAIESAGGARAFGPLPAEWKDDVLRVYFNFTPEKTP
jgi:protein TonB